MSHLHISISRQDFVGKIVYIVQANILSAFNFCYSWMQIIETLKEFKYQSLSTFNFCYSWMQIIGTLKELFDKKVCQVSIFVTYEWKNSYILWSKYESIAWYNTYYCTH